MRSIVADRFDDRIAEALRAIKKDKGKSFATEVSELLGETGRAPISPAERSAKAAAIRAMTPKDVVQTDSTEMIRELRDRGYAGR